MTTNLCGNLRLPAAALGVALCMSANVGSSDVPPREDWVRTKSRAEQIQDQEDQFRQRTVAAGIALSTVTAAGFLMVVFVRRRKQRAATAAEESGSAAKPLDGSLAGREGATEPPLEEESGSDDDSHG